MEKVIENKIKIIKLAVDYYQLLEILKYTECGNKLEIRTKNKMIIWYSNGQINCRTNYTDNKINGLYEGWYSNGQIQCRENYIDDKRDGSHEIWYSNGQLYIRENYIDDKRDGLYEEWCSNGQLLIKTNYTDDKINGLYEEWTNSWKNILYRRGKKMVQSKIWFLYGITYIKEIYLDTEEDK